MKRVRQTLVVISATLAVVFAGAAVAQDGPADPQSSQEACEAEGGVWTQGRNEFLEPVYSCEFADGTTAESAPEASPNPAEPAPATQTQPQYTG